MVLANPTLAGLSGAAHAGCAAWRDPPQSARAGMAMRVGSPSRLSR